MGHLCPFFIVLSTLAKFFITRFDENFFTGPFQNLFAQHFSHGFLLFARGCFSHASFLFLNFTNGMEFNMDTNFTFNILWWISVIEIPIIASMFRTMKINRDETDNNMKIYQSATTENLRDLSKQLFEYKLFVAQNYASIAYMKDIEKRLTDHLLRIEEKIQSAGER